MGTIYCGIDYSAGMANIDHEAGIHYGVIDFTEVLQAWADDSTPVYVYHCPYCGNILADRFLELLEGQQYKKCPSCKKRLTSNDFEYCDPCGYEYKGDGYDILQSNDTANLFIIKSPYYTYAQYCSPCVPGAGYLMACFSGMHDTSDGEEEVIDYIKNPKQYQLEATLLGFPMAYCLGHDWFKEGKAPYLVFSVEDDELQQPEK